MDHTDTTPTAPVSRRFLAQVCVGLLWFSAVLCGALLLSRALLLPRFTLFSVGGQTLSPPAMAVREQALRAQMLTLEEERAVLVLPFQDALFSHLKEEKRSLPSLQDVRRELRASAARSAPADQVALEAVTFRAADRRVEVRGDVRAGSSSLTVLAAFVDGVERLPFVADLERPSFVRVDDPSRGIHAPFAFSFTLVSPP